MAIAVASSSIIDGNDQTTLTVTAPTGITTGDLLVIIAASGNAVGVTSSGFTESFSYDNEYPSGRRGTHTVLYKYAVSADESEADYDVVSDTAFYLGAVVMLRVTGGVTAGDPVFQHHDSNGVVSTSDGLSVTEAVSVLRPTSQLNMLIATAWSSGNFSGELDNNNYTITSSDANPTWTELGDDSTVFQYTNAISWYGRLTVAYAASTDTSEVTEYSFDYFESSLDDTAGATWSYLTLHTPQNESDSNTLLETDTTLFAATGVTNTSASNVLLEVDPTFPVQSGEGVVPTSWTNTTKS